MITHDYKNISVLDRNLESSTTQKTNEEMQVHYNEVCFHKDQQAI